MSRCKKIIIAVMIVMIIAVGVVLLFRNKANNNEKNEVDINGIFENSDLLSLSDKFIATDDTTVQQDLKNQIIDYFNQLENNNTISNVLVKNNNIYFNCGDLEAMYMLEEFSDDEKGSEDTNNYNLKPLSELYNSDEKLISANDDKSVLILNSFSDSDEYASFNNPYKEVKDTYEAQGWTVDNIYSATVNDYIEKLDDYDCIYINSHGNLDQDSDPVISLYEPVTKETTSKLINACGSDSFYITGKIGETTCTYSIKPELISSVYDNLKKTSFIHGGFCYSYVNDSFAKAFEDAGAGAYLGYSESVRVSFDSVYATTMSSNISQNHSVKSSFDLTVSQYGKIDNDGNKEEAILWGDLDGDLVIYIDDSSDTDNQSQKEEISDAEKYAQIVMDNEDLWYTPWLDDGDETASVNSTFAWFQDLDFDDKLEFVVGTMNIQADSTIYGYDIFKINQNGTMKKISVNENSYYNRSITFAPRFDYVSTSMPVSVYKNNGTYRYITDDVNNSITDTGFRINEIDFGSDSISENTLFEYLYKDYGQITESNEIFESYEYMGEDVSKSELIEKLDSEIDNSTFYNVDIGTVPFGDRMSDITAPDDNDVNVADLGAISGCYDNLSDKEKLQALVDSYNAYKLVESEITSNYLTVMRDELESIISTDELANWQSLYIDYISNGNYRNLTTGFISGSTVETITDEDAEFNLAYLDDDDIPELFISGGYSVHIFTVYNGEMIPITTDNENGNIAWYGIVPYVERKGLFLDDYQRMGMYTTPIYKMENGKATLQSDIEYYEDSTGETFYINGNEVSAEEYVNELKKWNLTTYYTDQHPQPEIDGSDWIYLSTYYGYDVSDICDAIRNY